MGISVLCGCLRDVLESSRNNQHTNTLHVQLEGREYYSDGLVVENEDIVISGV